MDKPVAEHNYYEKISRLISAQKYPEALKLLNKKLEDDPEDQKALVLIEQLHKIMEYQNRDIFGSVNTNMDPWLE